MHRLTLAVAVLLTACHAAPPPPAPQTGFRPADAPIYSSAVLDRARLDGHWQQVAGMGADCPPDPANPDAVEITGDQMRWSLCLNGVRQGGSRALVMTKPGRFDVAGSAPWWVLWADGDYRTLVIGTPSGSMGFVLNRDADLPADRQKAAVDILRFNGYDTAQLRFF